MPVAYFYRFNCNTWSYPFSVTLVRVKLEKNPKTLARREVVMNLPRDAFTTNSFIDQYCAAYQDLFPEVRSDDNVSSSFT
jgi:hypothetical protein